ncbi:MAG: GDP-mannose 4,6-dehydratase [Patescibacteria group bacterium]|nr:GDP-mannose 4,6-dehydratase [Patescibacteria group bacterium]
MPRKVIFEQKNVLIVGGAGFIGSHLCDELIKTSKVICLDNFSTGDEKNIDHLLAEPNFEFIRHDITEPIDLKKIPELQKFKIEFQGIQEIYNLACPMSPKDFKNNRIKILLANSYGIKNTLDLAMDFKAKFLHISSSVIYGLNPHGKKYRESDSGTVDILSDRSAYDEGKRFAESMIMNYKNFYNLNSKIIRLFRVYGPRMKINDGQMIPDFISNALDKKDLIIYGDKNFSSSFCYISDCIDAIMKLMESNIETPINIGSDVAINLTDLADKIIKSINKNLKIEYKEPLVFMKPLCMPDISRARNELGWMPVIFLDKGLEKTIYELRASKGLKSVKEAI